MGLDVGVTQGGEGRPKKFTVHQVSLSKTSGQGNFGLIDYIRYLQRGIEAK